jgi:CelD/BcsL family acetyltransferase involved in cellulose biosynthesis
MRVRYSLNVTVITWLSDPYGQYGDVITSLRGPALDDALATALAAISREGADLVRLKFVREDALIAPFLRRHFRQTGEAYGAPWLDLAPYATPDDLEKRYTRTQRRRRRKIYKKLEKHLGAGLCFRRVTDLGEMRAAIPVLLENKREWLRQRGLVSRAIFHDRAEEFLLSLVTEMGARDEGAECILTVLEAGGRQLSWELGFRWKGRHYAYLTAHRPELTDFSIGRLHMHLAQRLAVADGMRVFDLLVPAAPHKKSWSSDIAPVRNHFLPLTVRGRLLGQAYLCHLRPMIRDIYHRLPAGVRSFLHLSDIHEHDEGQ